MKKTPVLLLTILVLVHSAKTDDGSGSTALSDRDSLNEPLVMKPQTGDRCSPNPCKNDGKCIQNPEVIDGYRCQCTEDFGGIQCDELKCRIGLARYASNVCLMKREITRKVRKSLVHLTSEDNEFARAKDSTPDSSEMIIPMLYKKAASSFVQSASTDPFTIEWYMKMTDNADVNKDLESHFTLKDPRFHGEPTLIDYAVIFETFYKKHKRRSAMTDLKMIPSVEENFFKDRCFADQRVAGVNPFQLWKVTKEKEDTGVSWKSFMEEKLNKEYDWHGAFSEALGVSDKDALEKALDDGQVYVTYFPELDGVDVPDAAIKDLKFNRTVIPLTAPIAFFVVKETDRKIKRLVPVAIQTDSNANASVYKPGNGKEWFLAKSFVQRADFNVLHLVHKRLKTHLYLDAFCTLVEKEMSEYHPIYQLMRQHCRAMLETNKLFEIKLYGHKGPIYNVLSIDYQSGLKLLNQEYKSMTFEDLDLDAELKKRGVGDQSKMPYYPYRDDGRKLYDTIRNFAEDYVALYYKEDSDVAKDEELKEWTNELSEDGEGNLGGLAMVKKLPAKLNTKSELSQVLATLLWTFTGHHAATTYPILDYGGFVPNAPHKLFTDDKGEAKFSNMMFGNKAVALEIAELSSNIASIHLDELFDYGPKLQDVEAGALVEKYHNELANLTQVLLDSNNERVDQGFLPYPYLLPKYVTNSIST